MVGSVTPARAVRDRAEAMFKAGDEFAIATDTTADPVLIGFVTQRAALVVAVPAADYDGEKLALWLGFPRVSAYERARHKKGS